MRHHLNNFAAATTAFHYYLGIDLNRVLLIYKILCDRCGNEPISLLRFFEKRNHPGGGHARVGWSQAIAKEFIFYSYSLDEVNAW